MLGLGYVGLTLGVALARRGVRVFGVERRPEVVKLANEGVPHFSEQGLNSALDSVLREELFSAAVSLDDAPSCDYYIITVGTPLHPDTHLPRLDLIEAATREVAAHFDAGATIILRSTVQVGTTLEVVRPILESTGKKFYLAMCPERTLEGDALRELSSLPQIIGASSPDAGDRAAVLFSRLTNTLVHVSDPATAEMIKLIDNTSRDVRFAFANEVARACDAIGIDANEVIKFGKLGYARTNVAKPGPVGGPCLEKDPHILMTSLRRYGVSLEITAASRLVNERQPVETVANMMDLLDTGGSNPPFVATVAGIAFKGVPETDDLRGSMSVKIVEALLATGKIKEMRVFDPIVAHEVLESLPYDLKVFSSLEDSVRGADLLVIGNNHPFFSRVPADRYFEWLPAHGIIYDYWNNPRSFQPRRQLGPLFHGG